MLEKLYKCIAFKPSYILKNIPSHTSLISQSQTSHPYKCIKKTEYAVRIRNAGKTGIFGEMLATYDISKKKKKKKKGEPIKFNSYSNNVKTLDFPKPARVLQSLQVKICRVGRSEKKKWHETLNSQFKSFYTYPLHLLCAPFILNRFPAKRHFLPKPRALWKRVKKVSWRRATKRADDSTR